MKASSLARTSVRLFKPEVSREWITALRLRPVKKHSHKHASDAAHAKATAQWLLQSQKATGTGGYAAGYSLFTGWWRPFPETTGYIIPSMLAAAKKLKSKKYAASANKAGEWLLKQQQKDGSFFDLDGQKLVFDNGQIIFGLLALAQGVKRKKYLTAATRAGDWMIKQQEKDGSWVKGTYGSIASTYYSRAAWALVELGSVTGKKKYTLAAKKHFNWVLNQQQKNGWFKNASFFEDEKPVLHTICYTIEGLLESGLVLKDKRCIAAAQKAGAALLACHQKQGYLVSYYKNWKPASKERCVTGMSQAALIFARLAVLSKSVDERERYKRASQSLKEETKHYQRLDGPNRLIGGVPGSVPVLGAYMRGTYPNWAAKFTLDLMLGEKHG